MGASKGSPCVWEMGRGGPKGRARTWSSCGLRAGGRGKEDFGEGWGNKEGAHEDVSRGTHCHRISTMGTGQCKGSPSRGWRLPWAHHHGDKAKEPLVARVPSRWGLLMGTWHGGLSVMQMGFEGQRWNWRWDLTLGVQTWGSSETRMGSEGQRWSSR